MIQIISPFKADSPEIMGRNVWAAKTIMRSLLLLGRAPVAPHLLYPQVLDEAKESERDQGIKAGCQLATEADGIAVWFWETEGPSEGMRLEIGCFLEENESTEIYKVGLFVETKFRKETREWLHSLLNEEK